MGEIIEALFILACYIFGIPIGIALLIFFIRRIILSISGEAKKTPAKETLESSFGCVFMVIACIALFIGILTL